MFESLYHHLAHALGITLPILVVLVLNLVALNVRSSLSRQNKGLGS